MKISLLIALFATTFAFHPVKDFRVKDMKVAKLHQKKDAKIANIADLLPSNTATVTTTDQLLSSAPTIELNEDIQMVFTDNTKSIYYLTNQIVDNSTHYNETFQLLLDTASSVTWVYNSLCSSLACRQSTISLFDNFDEPLQISLDFSLSYSGLRVTGDLINGQDNNIDLKFSNFEISNFTFGLASQVPDMFDGFNVSGILGIPSSNNKTVDRNLIYQLKQDDLIDKQVFGLSLVSSSQTIKYIDEESKSIDLPSNYGGVIVFGSKALDDKSKFISSQDLSFTTIIPNNNDYWLIELNDVKVNNESFNEGSSKRTIIDTGTTGFVLPLKDADELHEALFGDTLVSDEKGNYAFPCDDSDLKFTFSVDGHDFEISVNDFKGKEYTDQGLQGNCASMIQGLDSDQWVFGAAFLSKFYTVFDLEKGRIGFGDARITSYTLQEQSEGSYFGASALSNTGFNSTNTTTSTSSSASSTTSSSSSSSTSTRASSESSEDSDNSGAVVKSSGIVLLSLILYFVL